MVLLVLVLIIHVCRRPEIKVALLQTRGSYLSIYWQHLIKALPGVDNDQHCWTWKVLKCSILPLDLFSITGGKQMCKIGGLGLSVCFHTINETLGGTRLLFCSGTRPGAAARAITTHTDLIIWQESSTIFNSDLHDGCPNTFQHW